MMPIEVTKQEEEPSNDEYSEEQLENLKEMLKIQE